MSAKINPKKKIQKKMNLSGDLEGFRDFDKEMELASNLEQAIDEDELFQSADELEQEIDEDDDDEDDDDDNSSPNFIRGFHYSGIFGFILPIIIVFIVGYVLIKCIEEAISDN